MFCFYLNIKAENVDTEKFYNITSQSKFLQPNKKLLSLAVNFNNKAQLKLFTHDATRNDINDKSISYI